MEKALDHQGWYQVFPMGEEEQGNLRASMVLRHATGAQDAVPPGIFRRTGFVPEDGVPLLLPQQVHGCSILRAGPELCLPLRPPCDGVLLDRRGMRVALRFADCVPVLLWGLEPRPWMLGLHSGFKGTLLNISGRGIRLLKETFGAGALSSCRAWIGPGICGRCYVRKAEDHLATEIRSVFPQECWTEGADGIHPDLGKVIAAQLGDAGVASDSISRSSICSSCDHPFCYSYRRGDLLARMWLFFEIRDFLQSGQKNGCIGENV